ncbi:MAG: M48 family metallopeptidase [Candidatus Eisenbacteria bacterium]
MSGTARDEVPPRALAGNYVGTEVDGSWRKRYRRDGFLARGNGRYWWDEDAFYFLRHLTKRALRIPFGQVTGVRVGTSHAGRLGLWLRILKAARPNPGARQGGPMTVRSDRACATTRGRGAARGFAAYAAVLVTAAALLCAGCATVPITGRQQLSLVPQADLIQSAAGSYEGFLEGATIVTEGESAALVGRVGGRVARAAEDFLREEGLGSQLGYYDWEFSLVDDGATANAFCMPGGKIAVYTGLLPITASEGGLAVVVAHEVAHAIANHSGERMSQVLIAELGGMALSSAIEEKPADTQKWLMAAYGLGATVGVLMPYSRQHESEADRIGLTLMAIAGYDPRAAIPLWERMDEAGGQRPPEFLSTHPEPSSRIANIRKYLPEALEHYEER